MGVVAAAPLTRILIDQFDMSGFVNAADAAYTQETISARVFNSTGPINVPGNYDQSHKLTALYDGASNVGIAKKSDEVLYGMWASNGDHYYTELWGANAIGSLSYDSIVKLRAEPIKGAIGQLIVINADFVGNGPVARGKVLANLSATSSGSQAGQQLGPYTNAQTFQAVVRAVGGSSFSIAIEIEDATTSGAAYATMAGMGVTLTAAAPVARLTNTAGSQSFKRARIKSYSGSSTSVPIVITGGLVT